MKTYETALASKLDAALEPVASSELTGRRAGVSQRKRRLNKI